MVQVGVVWGRRVGETTACYSTCSRLQCVPAVVLVLPVVVVAAVVVVLVGPSSCFFMLSELL